MTGTARHHGLRATVLQPDLLVAPRSTLGGRKMVGPPVLAVEVLSPSTRLIDPNLKRAAFERAGVAAYWVVDPEPASLTAWHLVDRGYVEHARVDAGGAFETTAPFAFSLDPADLVRCHARAGGHDTVGPCPTKCAEPASRRSRAS